ncbi:MAG: DUF5804 family protein [Methanolinea sp.]|nr:DUF5804 family protein [Methanolinea sp.]
MRVIFVPREGVDLHSALLLSETSREALRFYQPEKTPAGVEVTVASLGSGLSLASDLRWYVRRYMRDVLFEIAPGTFCTRELAQDIYYGRAPVLNRRWRWKWVYTFHPEGPVTGKSPGSDMPGEREASGGAPVGEEKSLLRIDVWCTKDQFLGKKKGDGEEEITSL